MCWGSQRALGAEDMQWEVDPGLGAEGSTAVGGDLGELWMSG